VRGEAEVRALRRMGRGDKERRLKLENYIAEKLGIKSAHIALHHTFTCKCPICIKFWSDLRQKLFSSKRCQDCTQSTVMHRFGIFCNSRERGVSENEAECCDDFKLHPMRGPGGGEGDEAH